MTNNHSDFWQISILTDANQTILVTINKNDSVVNLFKIFREKYSASRRQKSFTFMVADGHELQDSDQRRLVDVECIRDKCNIQLIVHADGGVWPTEIEIRTQIRNPNNVPSLAGRITTDIPDIMFMDDETPCVKMSCGHVIAPTSLALMCSSELENGAHSIKCPAYGCDKVWLFTSIIDAACLTPNEADEFERKMIANKLLSQPLAIKDCPGCGSFCRRSEENETRIRCWKCTSDKARKFDFCWSCQKEWNNSISTVSCGNSGCGDHTLLVKHLAACKTKDLLGLQCPSIRACPNCLMLIEHTNKCKNMQCTNKRCYYKFCFICLKRYPCGTETYTACSLAPRQQTFSSPPPPPPNNNYCSIL